jgi:SAM-dependent methyltransferase
MISGETPQGFVTNDFVARQLLATDNELDYTAWHNSIKHLTGVFGPSSTWPPEEMTLEENAIDLAWHQREHETNSSYAFTVKSPDNTRLLGCVYINPPRKLGFDAEVFYWVTKDDFEAGLDDKLGDACAGGSPKIGPLKRSRSQAAIFRGTHTYRFKTQFTGERQFRDFRISRQNTGMDRTDVDAWNEHAPFYQAAVGSDTNTVAYAPDVPNEDELRLLGDANGKRVLDLGCGGGQNLIALARQGAKGIGIDFSDEQLRFARKLAEQEEVRIDFHESDVAELAFLPADNVDLVISTMVFHFVSDLPRVFRQVNRVLRTGGTFVFSMLHPFSDLFKRTTAGDPTVSYSHYEAGPIVEARQSGSPLRRYHHSFSEIYNGLTRSGFVVDNIIEPEPLWKAPKSIDWTDLYKKVPPVLIIRSHNIGS